MRRAWLAGSLPGATPQEALELVLRSPVGPHILFLPGGETDRPNSSASITLELARSGMFDIVKSGEFTSYSDMMTLTPTTDLFDLDLGYYERYKAESVIAQRICQQHHYALTFQVGIITPFGQSMATLGPGRQLKHRRSFQAATLSDIMQIYVHDESVIFQIECLLELCGALKAPSLVRPIVIRRMVANLTSFIHLCPTGLRIGIHPCLGDLNHEAMGHLSAIGPLVDWVNELCDTWPTGYTLAYVHLPLCEGAKPPITDPGWYTDLKRLRVPPGVRVILGVCHESVPTDALRPILALADSLLHRTVDVGASCGLALRGSRTLDDVYTILNQQAELCR